MHICVILSFLFYILQFVFYKICVQSRIHCFQYVFVFIYETTQRIPIKFNAENIHLELQRNSILPTYFKCNTVFQHPVPVVLYSQRISRI
jgi:hypothetical protein